jgi:hypothetical protein
VGPRASLDIEAIGAGRLVAGVAVSNPAEVMDVCFLCSFVVLSCVGRGIFEGLITRPGVSYCASNLV